MKPFYSHFLLPALIVIPLTMAATWGAVHLFQNSDSVVFDEPAVHEFTVEVRLAAAPSYDAKPYFGGGVPYLLVTIRSPEGGLHQALLEGDATPHSFTGYDACGTDFHFREFRVIAPVGGASNATQNVTYTSESYSSPTGLAPGGPHCAARAGVESEWSVTVRIEFDGIKDDPAEGSHKVTVDDWDFQHTYIVNGSATG